MFKASYFKYADIYSGKYNLIMAYVGRNQDFVTGAEYEPIIDTLPSRAESLLYGIKYSEKPLEFEVDIINPDEDIPMKQMIEIKDWLFGQDGWKKLYIKSPDYENMYLKCLFLPENDIRDSSGYRGVRCKVKNIPIIKKYGFDPDRCGVCDWCKMTKVLSAPRSLEVLNFE